MFCLLSLIFNHRTFAGHFRFFRRTFLKCPLGVGVRLKPAENKEKLPDISVLSGGRPAQAKRTKKPYTRSVGFLSGRAPSVSVVRRA